MPKPVIGCPVPRKDGRSKATGETKFVSDITLPDMLHGITIRSSVPRGKIAEIRFGDGVPWNEITIVSAKDIPGINIITHVTKDQPCLAESFINHAEEPILLLAHADPAVLEAARTKIEIEIDPLPPVLSIEDSLEKTELIFGQDNILASYRIDKGNVDEIWSSAEHLIEGEYKTGAQEHLYLETQGVIATASPSEGITVWGSIQCPYFVQHALQTVFDLKTEQIRVIQTETGGAFGGKEDFPSMLAAHASLLAWKSGKPVKMIYTRSEDIRATTKRHPSLVKICTAVDGSGTIHAMQTDFILDGGAYTTLSPVVLLRGAIHAGGPYSIPNVRIHARAVATNTPPNGAFRGFGAPQAFFALERHMDKIAKRLSLTPREVRTRNFLHEGQTTATQQIIRTPIHLDSLLDRALHLSQYEKKRERFSRHNIRKGLKRGIGMAVFMHGTGFTGSGEKRIGSVVEIEADKNGDVQVLVSSVEMGQGTNTILAQIVADALHIKFEMVTVVRPDTSVVPDSGPTVASRTAMVVGGVLRKAAEQLRQQLTNNNFLNTDYSIKEFRTACAKHIKQFGFLKIRSQYEQPPDICWNDEQCQGDAYAAYSWGAHVAEVSIDPVTYEIRVERFIAVHEVGDVLHPILAEGQIRGGIVQGIGFTLYEDVIRNNGRIVNDRITNYILPMVTDIGEIRIEFLPPWHAEGGPKGIGELPMNGVAPAILNALENALDQPIVTIPLRPEDLVATKQKEGAR